MKGLRLILAGAALAALAWTPASHADDELEVTLQVLDDLSDLDGGIIEMPGPGDEFREDDFETGDDEDGTGEFGEDGAEMREEDPQIRDFIEVDESEFGGIEDDFEHDDVDTDIEDDLDEEDDFEEEEDVFDDDFDDDDEDSDFDDMDDEEDDSDDV